MRLRNPTCAHPVRDGATGKCGTCGTRQLNRIAREIQSDWVKVNYAARPYLDAMRQMNDISEPFCYDSGVSIVLYFLSNAASWRGEVARRVKAELKGMAKREGARS